MKKETIKKETISDLLAGQLLWWIAMTELYEKSLIEIATGNSSAKPIATSCLQKGMEIRLDYLRSVIGRFKDA